MVHVRAHAAATRSGGPPLVFLLEAYVAAAASDADPVGDVLRAIRGDSSLRLLGTVVIPRDEAMLCLIEAPSEQVAEELVRRLGRDAIRVVEVRWLPTRIG